MTIIRATVVYGISCHLARIDDGAHIGAVALADLWHTSMRQHADRLAHDDLRIDLIRSQVESGAWNIGERIPKEAWPQRADSLRPEKRTTDHVRHEIFRGSEAVGLL